MTIDGKQVISTSTHPSTATAPSVLSEDCARLASAESAAASAVERAAELAELLANAARGEGGSGDGTKRGAASAASAAAAGEAASAFLAAVREAQTTLIPAAKKYERPGEPPFAGDAAPERARLAAASLPKTLSSA